MPAARPEIVAVVAPLLQRYMKGPTPVRTVTVEDPLFNPQVVVAPVAESVTATEEPTVSVAVAEQPPKPVTVTL
jgi:hypothetical protein